MRQLAMGLYLMVQVGLSRRHLLFVKVRRVRKSLLEVPQPASVQDERRIAAQKYKSHLRFFAVAETSNADFFLLSSWLR